MGADNFDYDAAAGEDEIDLNGIGAALRRNRRLIVGVTIASAAAAVLFCFLVKPRYMAESRILVENQESYFTRSDPNVVTSADTAQLLDEEAVNSQIQLLTSRDLARRAIVALHLKGNPEFDPAASRFSVFRRIFSLFGLASDPSRQAPEDRLLNAFADHLTVMSPTKTRVLQVEFSSHDPELASRGANVIADIYIDMKKQAKREDARQAAKTLKPLVASLERRVAAADNKIEAFRARNGLYETGLKVTTPTQQLGEIAAKLADARAAQSQAQAKAHSLRALLRQGRLGDAGAISKDPLVQRIAAQRVLVQSRLAYESRTLLPGHPRIKELRAQLADLDSQLRLAVDKAARGLEDDARVDGAQVANLTQLLAAQKRVVGESNADQTQLQELQRNDKALKDEFAIEAAKYQAALARVTADAAPADARIISRAVAPSKPIFPRKLPITLFAALAGLAFSVGGVVARELTVQRVEGEPLSPPPPRDMAAEGEGVQPLEPAAGTMAAAAAASGAAGALQEDGSLLGRLKQAVADYAAPAVEFQEDEAEETDEKDETDEDASDAPEEDAERSPGLVQRLVAAAAHGGVRVLVISAEDSAPDCASLVLGRALAREGRAVLAQVDDDDACLREALAEAVGRDENDGPQPGLAQLLAGEASFAEAIHRDATTRLHIVQSGGPIATEESDLRLIVDALHETYDFVVIAAGAEAAAAGLAAEAEMTVVFGRDAHMRDFLYDGLATVSAREIVRAGFGDNDEIVEIAA